MPNGASSLARDHVIPFTAVLLTGYAIPLGCPQRLTIELVLMITPPPCFFITLDTERIMLSTALTLRSIIFLNLSNVYESSGVESETPALLARISILPYFSTVLSTKFLTDSSSKRFGQSPATSHEGFSSLSFATALSTVSCLEPSNTTFAPFSRYFLTIE